MAERDTENMRINCSELCEVASGTSVPIGSTKAPIESKPEKVLDSGAPKKIPTTAEDCAKLCEEATETITYIWVLGAPGAGKGTQSAYIAKQFGYICLSTDQLIKDEILNKSEKGEQLIDIMDSCKVLPNGFLVELVKSVVDRVASKAKGIVFDGFPREKEQAELFERIIGPVDMIIYLEAQEDILVKRLLGAANLVGRDDETETTIKERIQTFKENHEKFIPKYRPKLQTINANDILPNIYKQVETIVGKPHNIGK